MTQQNRFDLVTTLVQLALIKQAGITMCEDAHGNVVSVEDAFHNEPTLRNLFVDHIMLTMSHMGLDPQTLNRSREQRAVLATLSAHQREIDRALDEQAASNQTSYEENARNLYVHLTTALEIRLEQNKGSDRLVEFSKAIPQSIGLLHFRHSVSAFSEVNQLYLQYEQQQALRSMLQQQLPEEEAQRMSHHRNRCWHLPTIAEHVFSQSVSINSDPLTTVPGAFTSSRPATTALQI